MANNAVKAQADYSSPKQRVTDRTGNVVEMNFSGPNKPTRQPSPSIQTQSAMSVPRQFQTTTEGQRAANDTRAPTRNARVVYPAKSDLYTQPLPTSEGYLSEPRDPTQRYLDQQAKKGQLQPAKKAAVEDVRQKNNANINRLKRLGLQNKRLVKGLAAQAKTPGLNTLLVARTKVVTVGIMLNPFIWMLWLIGLLGFALSVMSWIGWDTLDESWVYWATPEIVSGNLKGAMEGLFATGWIIGMIAGWASLGVALIIYIFTGALLRCLRGWRLVTFLVAWVLYAVSPLQWIPWVYLWLWTVLVTNSRGGKK